MTVLMIPNLQFDSNIDILNSKYKKSKVYTTLLSFANN